ncbi:MAG TPA: membrane protein insertase YidC [Gammaproteobacteria bacterium]|nr:membrane protein insertase YidC [Gammaproteobacteria bacterium]
MDQVRLFLIVALGLVLLLIWQAWQKDYGPLRLQSSVQSSRTDTAAASVSTAQHQMETEDKKTATTPPVSGQKIHVQTDTLDLVIDTAGGNIVHASLRDYPISLEQPRDPFVLLDDSEQLFYVAQSGLLSTSDAPDHHALFTSERDDYELTAGAETLEVPMSWHSASGVEVVKIFRFTRRSHLVTVEYKIRNRSGQPWTGELYAQLQRAAGKEARSVVNTYTGAALSSPERRYEKLPFRDFADKPISRNIQNGWAAILQHYFIAALIPNVGEAYHYHTKALDNQHYVIGAVGPEHTVPAGGEGTVSIRFYLGPKTQDTLERIAPGLDLTVDYGALWFIAKPLFWFLKRFHALTGNWGWAIIILTVLVKGLFYPLSAASYRSMAKMRAVQPRILALRERYADDKTRLNQAMMDLYKEKKINPLGGCLPVLIQIPVFLSLYWVLLESVELRQAPFVLWIHDMSAADPYFVLPLFMGATMFFQQRLNPPAMDPTQQRVMQLMPVVFTMFFAFFPSGLVLYWCVNNLLSILQQAVITRSMERGKTAT